MSDEARSAHMAACAAVSEELGARMAASRPGGRPPPGLATARARRSEAPAFKEKAVRPRLRQTFGRLAPWRSRKAALPSDMQ